MSSDVALRPVVPTTVEGGAARVGRRKAIAAGIVGLGAATLAAALAFRALDAPTTLGFLIFCGACTALLARPELGAVLFTFLLYSNVPAVLQNVHGAPPLASGAFVLVLGFPLVRHLLLRRARPRVDAVFLLMLALMSAMIVTTLVRARDTAIAVRALANFATEGLLLYWLVINTVRSPADLRRVVWAVLAAGAILGALPIYQVVTGSFDQQFAGLAARVPRFETVPGTDGSVAVGPVGFSYRADGPQLGHNRFAQTMMALLPLALLAYRLERRRLLRLAAASCGVLIVVGGVALTYSRGAIVSMVVLVGTALALRWIPRGRTLAVVAALVLLLPVTSPQLVQRITSLRALAALNDPSRADGALRGRATEMLAALLVFRDHPILGVGPGQYAPIYSVEYHDIPDIQFRDIQGTRRAHMLYFELGAESGVVGLALFLAIPGVLLRGLWRARRRFADVSPQHAQLATAMLFSLLTYLVSALFLSLAFQRYYWFLIGLASAALYLLRVAEDEIGPAAVEAPAPGSASHGRQTAAVGWGWGEMIETIVPSSIEVRAARERVAAAVTSAQLRRLDWRFLLPAPDFGEVAYSGPNETDLVQALAGVSASVDVLPRDDLPLLAYDIEPRYDLVVLESPDQVVLAHACHLLRPGGWIYCEIDRSLGLRRLVRRARLHPVPGRGPTPPALPRRPVEYLRALGFERVRAHWHFPDFAAVRWIVPLEEAAVIGFAGWLSHSLPAARLLGALAGRAARSGRLQHVPTRISLVGRKRLQTGEVRPERARWPEATTADPGRSGAAGQTASEQSARGFGAAEWKRGRP